MTEPPGARLRVGLTGLTVAEYFRDVEKQDVLLFIDNIFRFTQAGSEVSAFSDACPPPSDTSQPGDGDGRAAGAHHVDEERIDHVRAGIYVPADDLTDPAPATAFAHLDATTVLSPDRRARSLRPSILSRPPHESSTRILGDEHYSTARGVKPFCRSTKTSRTSSPSSASTSCRKRTRSSWRARARFSASCRSRSTSPSSSPASRANT